MPIKNKIITDSLLFRDAHDLKGIHSLSEQVLVLLARNCHVSVGQEAVLAVVLQTQLSWIVRRRRRRNNYL